MQLLHTSPTEITEITNNGTFDDCLFFSADEYAMGKASAVYSLAIEEDNIISVSELDDNETVVHIATALNCSEERAFNFLTGEIENAGDITGDYEDDWFVQAQQGAAAKAMGFEAAESRDEQGAVYIVPMLNRNHDLIRIK